MKVGHLIASVSRQASGAFQVARKLAINTQKLGHEVLVFGLKDRFTEADLPAWGTVPLRTHPIVGPQSFGFSPGLVRSLQNAGLDLLHVHGLWMYPSIASLRLCRRGKLPCVISPHGHLDPWALQHSAWKKWKKKIATWLYEGAHLRTAACLVALCESEAAALRAFGLRNPVCVIPSGQELPPDTAATRPLAGSDIAPGRKVLLFLSRLHPQKGLPDLLRAWAMCRKAAPEAANWELVLAGGDQNGHEHVLRRMVVELGIGGSVLFTGALFNEEKVRAFQRAEAFILPSLSEGLPIAVLEAWGWRLPVLMTPQCHLPEGFAEGAAISVDPNVESLSHGLRTLFRMSDAEREQMGARGRRLVEQRFAWPRVAQQMVGVYQWVLGEGPRPDCVQET